MPDFKPESCLLDNRELQRAEHYCRLAHSLHILVQNATSRAK